MSLLVPQFPALQWSLTTVAGVRPGPTLGQLMTPGVNTKGSWAEMIDGALMLQDTWFCRVTIHSNFSTNTIRELLLDIGIDPTAGTSYAVIIPDLLGSSASAGSSPYGVSYDFPLHIPAGSSVAVRAAGTVATQCRATMHFWGNPRYPESTAKGRVVQAIGANAAASNGTAITSGTTNEGSWTSLGTVTREAWWWQMGFGCSDASMGDIQYGIDLSAGAAAGGEIMLIDDQRVNVSSGETIATAGPGMTCRQVPAGHTIYARAQCSGTADTAISIVAYALS